MTNQNYTQEDCHNMSNQEIIRIINSFNKSLLSLTKFLENNYQFLLNEIEYRTKFLNLDADYIPIGERLYCIEHELNEHPLCRNPHCTNKVEWRKTRKSFKDYCSKECMYSDKTYWDQVRQTCNNRYGDVFPSRCKSIQNKIVETNRERYGCDRPTQSKEIKDKVRNTCIDRYNVENPMQVDEFKKHMFETNIQKFGQSSYSQTEEFKIRFEETCQTRFGVSNPMQAQEIYNKMIETNNKVYGVDHPIQNKNIQLKLQSTCKSKYGVSSYSQTPEFHQKCHKKYTNEKYPGITFGSSWEFKVYDFLTEHDIEFKYQLEPIPYEYDGKTYYYIPDFLINGRIYEVKGDMFFRVNESTGKEEMFCPYRYDDWSDEHYIWMCGKYEAKHQCMIKNNVVILRNDNIKNLTIEMFND